MGLSWFDASNGQLPWVAWGMLWRLEGRERALLGDLRNFKEPGAVRNPEEPQGILKETRRGSL